MLYNNEYGCMTPAVKSYEEIIKDVRMKHSIVGNKHGRIVKPVHRTEFYRMYRTKSEEKCEVLRFYFTSKREFKDALSQYYERKQNPKVKYKQVGYANVNLRLCWRCHDAEKTMETDLYFVNILNNSSHIRETLCYGCMGAIINETTL